MSGRVIVVGSVNVDLVVTTEHLPTPGETVIGGRFARHHGGKGGNQAVAAARLGAPTFLVGAVGGDVFGSDARAALEAEGVDVSGLLTVPDEATGVALILVDAGGENSIAVAGGANAALGSVQVRTALKRLALTRDDVVLVGHEIRTGATHEALRLGRIAGATTILNPAPATGLEPPTLALADLLTPNRGELAALAGADGRASVQAKRLLGPEPGPPRGPGQPWRGWRAPGHGPAAAGDQRAARRRGRFGGGGRHAQWGAGGCAGGRVRPVCRGSSCRRRRVSGGHPGGCPRGDADAGRARGGARRLSRVRRWRRPRRRRRRWRPRRRASRRPPSETGPSGGPRAAARPRPRTGRIPRTRPGGSRAPHPGW